jgi:hypothetical protein
MSPTGPCEPGMAGMTREQRSGGLVEGLEPAAHRGDWAGGLAGARAMGEDVADSDRPSGW